jgi:hypothetical protein
LAEALVNPSIDIRGGVEQPRLLPSNKAMSVQFAPLAARSRARFEEAAANLQKPEGVKYQKDIEQSISKWMQQCAPDDTDRTKFGFMLQVAADGGPQGAWMPHPTAIGNCLLKRIYDAHVKNELRLRRHRIPAIG